MLSVIAFHVSPWLPGGFLGVDVFFVLSGYLITTLLLREHLSTGRIRLGSFWARRARRLLPAIFLLIAVCAVVVAREAPFSTLDARREDMAATLLYYANWHFIATAESYFAGFEGASPLRHTWSLAIEEQYYVVWPLALLAGLWLFRRRPQVLLIVTAVMLVVSVFLMATAFREGSPSRAYYGTDSRAHVLLAGAALAMVLHMWPKLVQGERARLLARTAGPLVAIAVVVAFVQLRDTEPDYYQGGSAAFAILVAVALWVLEADPRSYLAKALSLRPVVWVGTISYGLYLWHWPIILWLGESARLASWNLNLVRVLELTLTFGAAAASFVLVEKPVRQGRLPWVRRADRRLAVVVVAVGAAVGALVIAATRVPGGLGAQLADTSDVLCPSGSPSVGGFAVCSRTEPARAAALVVATVGDSTSRALDPGMRKVAAARGWRYVQAGQGGCSILPLTLTYVDRPEIVAEKRACVDGVRQVLAQTERLFRPDVWIVSDGFPIHLLVLPDGRVLADDDPLRIRTIAAAMRSQLRSLAKHGANVVVVGVPPVGQPIECAVESRADASCDADEYSVRNRDFARLDLLYRSAVVGLPRVTYVSVTDVLCPAGGCLAMIDGVLARYDGTHYTGEFSRRIVPVIVRRAELVGALQKRSSAR